MATSNCLVTNILQNKCYVQQKKEIHAGLEQHEEVYDATFVFLVNYPFNSGHSDQI